MIFDARIPEFKYSGHQPLDRQVRKGVGARSYSFGEGSDYDATSIETSAVRGEYSDALRARVNGLSRQERLKTSVRRLGHIIANPFRNALVRCTIITDILKKLQVGQCQVIYITKLACLNRFQVREKIVTMLSELRCALRRPLACFRLLFDLPVRYPRFREPLEPIAELRVVRNKWCGRFARRCPSLAVMRN